jgi:hypothetical protein
MVRPRVAGRFNAQPAASTLDGVSQSQRLALVLGLNLALVAALVIVGVTAHSLGVLAAGVDYLADAAAIAVSPENERQPAVANKQCNRLPRR